MLGSLGSVDLFESVVVVYGTARVTSGVARFMEVRGFWYR